MNPDSESSAQIRRLIVLKRYEQPPPGYFNRLPGEIIAQLRAAHGNELTATHNGSWFQRFMDALQTKPSYAGGFGVAVCGVLMISAFYSSEPLSVTGQSMFALPSASPLSAPLLNNDARTANVNYVPGAGDAGTLPSLFRTQYNMGVPQPVFTPSAP